MIALNLFSTAAQYTQAGTRVQPLTTKINLQVSTAGVFLQTCDDQGNFFDDEEFYPPGAFSILRRCGGARIRSAVAASPAVISFTLLTDSD